MLKGDFHHGDFVRSIGGREGEVGEIVSMSLCGAFMFMFMVLLVHAATSLLDEDSGRRFPTGL